MTRYWRRGWVPDLNHLPPVDDPSLDGLIGFSILPDSGPQSAAFTCRRPPHLEIIDDEVALISPRAFAQAKCSSTRNLTRRLHDVLGEAAPGLYNAGMMMCGHCKRKMPEVDSDLVLELGISNKKAKSVAGSHEFPAPKESIYRCPVCISDLVEPTSTKCGHIFCKECLRKSLASSNNKCPTCRQKVGRSGTFRVYLPTAN
ncbi:TNF receptor-associated factor 6-A [Linum perenne]